MASDDHDLRTEDGPRAALREANPAIASGFLSEDRLVARFREVPQHEYARYYLNRWVDRPDRALPDAAWETYAEPGREITTDVVLALDSSFRRMSSSSTSGSSPRVTTSGACRWARSSRPSSRAATRCTRSPSTRPLTGGLFLRRSERLSGRTEEGRPRRELRDGPALGRAHDLPFAQARRSDELCRADARLP